MTPRQWKHKLWRIGQGEKGLCVRCSAPAVDGISMCQRHREINNAAVALRLRRKLGHEPQKCTCGRCGGLGHNVRTCTQEAR